MHHKMLHFHKKTIKIALLGLNLLDNPYLGGLKISKMLFKYFVMVSYHYAQNSSACSMFLRHTTIREISDLINELGSLSRALLGRL